MDSSAYKETYRHDMILWSEGVRNQDPNYFCRLATAEADRPVWLICDARRESDMQFFTEVHGALLLTVRVQADDQVRKERGWVYTKEVDGATSECGLDGYKCRININNSSPCEEQLTSQLEQVKSWVQMMMNSSQ